MVHATCGDSLEVLRGIEDNFVDAVVCDPPYFLTNSSGSGFMGKQWDSLSVRNAFAESVLRSLVPAWLLEEVSSAEESASTNIKRKEKGLNIHVLYAAPKCIEANRKLNQSTFSALTLVLTRAEVLALCRELSPSLTAVVESQPRNVLYVVNSLSAASCPKSIAQELASRLHTKQLCEEIEILHSLMGDQKTKDAIAETTGKKSGSKFISATSSSVENVENIVAQERYSATTLSCIDSQKTIQWITSLPSVRSAMAKFMESPGNIQLLSERFHYSWLKEVYRVMKPGAHLLAFAGTRTYHRLVLAAEDAGFEIRDQLQWLYGSGFPKSHDISKAIDKANGSELKVGTGKTCPDIRANNFSNSEGKERLEITRSIPNSPEAKQWQGFGTALKPANEPIVLARKPLSEKTVAKNVLKWGTGGLNIDGCRIGYTSEADKASAIPQGRITTKDGKTGVGAVVGGVNNFEINREEWANKMQGRWPANIILDEQAAELLDEQVSLTMNMHSAGKARRANRDLSTEKKGMFPANGKGGHRFEDSHVGASRFFYIAKASKSERNCGGAVNCTHPTVKPIRLMQYLCKLITPPNGIVLDPFMGSGTTGIAALKEGFGFIGIELDPEYFEIAKARLKYTQGKASEGYDQMKFEVEEMK